MLRQEPIDASVVEELLDRWVAHGLITSEQAQAIRRAEGSRLVRTTAGSAVPVARRVSLISEAFGYLGGVLIIVAASLITAQYWSSLSTWAQLMLPAAAAVVLLAAGWAAYRHPSTVTSRLRSVLWLASTAATAFALWVLGSDILVLPAEENVALLMSLGTAVLAGVLWALHRTFIQQMALFVALVITVAASAAHLQEGDSAPMGLAVWGLGLVWLALAWGGLLGDRLGPYVLGAVASLLGALATISAGDWGYVFAVLTVAGLLGLAVLVGDLVVLGIAAIGALIVLPAAVVHFFPGVLAAPLALLVTGILLILAALRTTRRRRRVTRQDTDSLLAGDRRLAIALAGAAGLVATAAAVLVGLVD